MQICISCRVEMITETTEMSVGPLGNKAKITYYACPKCHGEMITTEQARKNQELIREAKM